jgi:hypothetical protein
VRAVAPLGRSTRQKSSLIALSGILSVLALGALAVVACSNQPEGARCQLDNDNDNGTNDDCDEGLVCRPSKDLALDPVFRGQPSDREGRCCPADRAAATVAECKVTPSIPGSDGSAPTVDAATDAGNDATDGNVTPDAPADAPVEADLDAAPDASTDANEAG